MKVEIQTNHYDIRVMIDGLPHVFIDRKEFVGFQAWTDCPTICVIEYYTKTNTIRTEQDSVEKWKIILNALNEQL